MTDPIIRFDKVNKWYGNGFHVLRDIDLTVAPGERMVICGPSGSGKSTLIRCINALEDYQEGKLTVAGSLLGDDVKAMDAVRRQVGMVFQQFNLFPHLTVLENLTLSPTWVGRLAEEGGEERAMRSWSACASPSRPASTRCSCRAASSSAWPSRARCA
jgi:general L-amino acid transport system ATP-binding protein